MDWREYTIARHRKEIERLQADIALMKSGKMEMRHLQDGNWVVTNEGCIASDLKTIEELEGIIARAEAELAAQKENE